jgi:hypothetical protein
VIDSSLWSRWRNECCLRKHAHHAVVYPANLTADEKLLLVGSGLCIALTLFERSDDDHNDNQISATHSFLVMRKLARIVQTFNRVADEVSPCKGRA